MSPVAGAKAGWYPDYESSDGELRYWDGERWTDRRRPVERHIPPGWPYIVAAVVVVVLLITFVVARLDSGDDPDEAGDRAPAQSTAGPTDDESDDEPSEEPSGEASDGASDDPGDEPSGDPAGARLWDVVDVLDSVTLELGNGATVRLYGVEPLDDELCAADAADELAELVVDSEVSLVRKGPDKDEEGNLLRYVDLDGVDVGLRLLQRGLATASDEPNPRRAIYQRVDERSPDVC